MIEKQVAVTLATIIVTAIVGVGYFFVEPVWREEHARQIHKKDVTVGKELFNSQACITCHLDNGYGTAQGGAGWPLNTTQNQRGSATELEARRQALKRTIERGRANTAMSPFSRDNGGGLNDEQIDQLVAYIQSDEWPSPPVTGAGEALAKAGAAAAAPAGGTAGAGSKGAQLFQSNCQACHTLTGAAGVGPSLQGVATRAGTRKPGMEAQAYIKESIEEPSAFVVKDFASVPMPKLPLSADDVKALVDYLMEQK